MKQRPRGPALAFARWCSDVASPPVCTILTLALTAVVACRRPGSALAWIIALSAVVALVPLLYILSLVQRGKVTDIHLPVRRERTGPIVVTLVSLLTATYGAYYFAAPLLLQRLMEIYLAHSLVLAAITVWWKISFHTAAVSLFVGSSLVLLGAVAAPLLALVPLVGWSRVTLRRHTLLQVIAGTCVGLVTAALL